MLNWWYVNKHWNLNCSNKTIICPRIILFISTHNQPVQCPLYTLIITPKLQNILSFYIRYITVRNIQYPTLNIIQGRLCTPFVSHMSISSLLRLGLPSDIFPQCKQDSKCNLTLEANSCNHCSRRKAVRITYHECMSVC